MHDRELKKTLVQKYSDMLDKLKFDIDRVSHIGDQTYSDVSLWLAWYNLYPVGRTWSVYVIDHLDIPRKNAKGIEMAARVFIAKHSMRKGPRGGIIKWYEKNKKRLDLLLDATSWKERTDDDAMVIKHNGLTLHNTIGANDKKVNDVAHVFDIVYNNLSKTGLPGIKRVYYGDVFLVGQIERKNWAAWYMPKKDAIYFRPNIRGQTDKRKAITVIHELCHRYWKLYLSTEKKNEWKQHHIDMIRAVAPASLPEIGDTLDMIVNRKTPMVESYEGPNVYLADVNTGTRIGVLKKSHLLQWVREINHGETFPTLYAKISPEEHFCEAAALRAFGDLDGSNLESFNKIFT